MAQSPINIAYRDIQQTLAIAYNKPCFWTGTYFVSTGGGVTVEQLKKYVEAQDFPPN
ncbi:transposase [Spirulina subsalsa]|uniref:transposase n=1 Tax=Spirulina subsalsa TaxID=54311 RepID=UPI0038B2ECFA